MNPTHVGKGSDDRDLLEIVCARELVTLLALTNVLNYLNAQKVVILEVRIAGPISDICAPS